MEKTTPDIRTIWNQKNIPIAYRPPQKGEILLRLPFAKDNRNFLQQNRKNKPEWLKDKKCWQLPRSWFNDIVESVLRRHKKLYIIQPYREQEKCAPACWNAKGHECQCSCMGENHGQGQPGGSWFIVSETFATTWRAKKLACRLLEVK